MENFLFVGKVIQDRLFRRFKLRDHPELTDPMFFQKVIIPVSNIDDLLKDPVLTVTAAAVAGTGWVTLHICPKGKKEEIKTLYIEVSSGTFTFTDISIHDGTTQVNIEKPSAGTTRQVAVYAGITLKEDWTIRVYVNSYTNPGNLESEVMTLREDAYQ